MELPGVLADEEGEVFLPHKREVRGEDFLQPIEGAAGGPTVRGGEFGEPGAGRSKEEMSAGFEERWQTVEKLERPGKAADEVGGVDQIEGAEGVREVHGVTLLEGNAVHVDMVREMGGERFGEMAFPCDLIGHTAFGLNGPGGLDEGLGIVDADDFPAGF